MRYVALLVLLECLLIIVAACGGSPTAAAIDPPAMVHVVNNAGVSFEVYTIIIGSDSAHSGIANQGTSDLTHPGTLCMNTGQVHGERTFVEVAALFQSPLDTLLNWLASYQTTAKFIDSLVRGTLTVSTVLARKPGLVAVSTPFDPAPVGYTFPPDTVFWTWTVGPNQASSIVNNQSDGACHH
jgi:hypothetical protein